MDIGVPYACKDWVTGVREDVENCTFATPKTYSRFTYYN